jgi:hypothetical protein
MLAHFGCIACAVLHSLDICNRQMSPDPLEEGSHMESHLPGSKSAFRLDALAQPASALRLVEDPQSSTQDRIVRDMLLITRMTWSLPLAVDAVDAKGLVADLRTNRHAARA